MNRLALGTAQFGMPYGIVNRSGCPDTASAAAILQRAAESGMNTLDTAMDYGDSERLLGECGVADWRVITKLPAVPDDITDIGGWMQDAVEQSLQRLGLNRLHGLLLHRPKQLLEPQGQTIHAAMRDIRQRGLVQSIGVSIYSPADMEALYPNYKFDLVQAPLNVFNRQLVNTGWLSRLGADSVEIHVRSIFLQGLLLQSPRHLPDQFTGWQTLWEQWHAWLTENGLTPLQACLHFVLAQQNIDRVIVGVDNLSQLEAILAAAAGNCPAIPPALQCDDPALINPSHWQSA